MEDRREYIGGSDSPAILGVDPWRGPADVYAEKRGLTADNDPTPAMKRGTALEPLVADMYAEATGRTLQQVPELLKHPGYEFIAGHIDRAIIGNGNGNGVLEIKCPGAYMFRKIVREGVPDYYQIQLQHYLAVTGAKWGSLAIFNSDAWRLEWFDLERDDELIEQIMQADIAFWNRVQFGEPPENQPQKQIDLPPIDGSVLDMSSDPVWAAAVEDLKQAREYKAAAEEYEATAKDTLINLMGAAKAAEGAGVRCYRRVVPGRKTIDTARLKQEKPLIYERYLKEGKPYTTFTPYFLGGNHGQ